jgi:hypothetical protein
MKLKAGVGIEPAYTALQAARFIGQSYSYQPFPLPIHSWVRCRCVTTPATQSQTLPIERAVLVVGLTFAVPSTREPMRLIAPVGGEAHS